jgi:transposase InsO family protein
MEVPPRPWHTLGADLFHHDKVWYLIIADYYSKFPFIRKLDNLTASTITRVSRVLFAEQGIPEVIVCDNGTQFTSSQFRALAQQYGFRIQTSSPYYPRGHGFIERHIQTVKRILTKCRESGDDPN